LNLTTYFKDFENFLKLERNLSVNTIKSYRSDLKKLEFYLSKTSAKKLSFIDPDIVRGFLYEQSKRVSAKTQGRIISTLKTFFNFLVLEKLINDSPIENIDYPKIDSKIPLVLTTYEIDKLISCAFSKKFGLRNQTIIEIMYSCGLRVSELTEMKISNIFFDESLIKILGKGNKERFIPLSSTAKKLLYNYITYNRKNLSQDKQSIDIVFLNNRGKKLTRVMVYNIINDAALEAKINKKISPHTLRHSFATHLIENGADIISIQKMMGHENVVTTEKYLHVNKKHLVETMIKFHPRK
jgi:integrase/recombinase XerD|tara:strand:+ start:2130 stop:3020 length:891 start_codon:yes stop_codon:yes gene_type:complete